MAAAQILRAVAAGARPSVSLPIDQWAEKYLIVPASTGANLPGRYRVDRTPPARRILQALSVGHPCKRVVVRAAAQFLKTQTAIAFIGSTIDQNPANILVLLPTLSLSKRVSARISKTIEAVDVLREKVASPRSRDARNTVDAKEYPGGTCYIATAGSASNLGEIPARFVYGDEIDRWESNLDGEGDPVKLATARTTTFEKNKKLYFTSTPTIEGDSAIDRLMSESTAAVYKVPCPHCSTFIEIEWESIRWAIDENNQVSRAWAVCPECGSEIDESAKAVMLPAGDFFPTQMGDGETEGFHLPGTLYPLGNWPSWASLAKEYLAALEKKDQGDADLMTAFWNVRLARSYRDVGEQLQQEVLQARGEKGHQLRLVPEGGLVLIMSVDTQDDRLECMLVAYGRDEQSWVIDYKILYGDPAQESVWLALDEYRRTPVLHQSGQVLGVSGCGIDSQGHHAHTVYNYCRQRESQRVFALKGVGDESLPIKKKNSLIDVNFSGRQIKHGVRLWFVGTHQAKDVLARRLKFEIAGPGYIHFPAGLDSKFYEGLCAEERRTVRTARGTAQRWIKASASARNEPWDLMVYALFVMHVLEINKYTDADWRRLESVVAPVQQDLLALPVSRKDESNAGNVPPEAQPPEPMTEKKPIIASRPGTISLGGWKRGS